MEIHEEYIILVNKFRELANGPILKTDAFQESINKYWILADVYMDNDDGVIEKATKNGHTVVKTDIREMSFEDESFGMVVDTSTIDHIEEYPLALDEYKRVLKKDGYLVLISWFNNLEEDTEGAPIAQWRQLYFALPKFKEELEKRFKIELEGHFENLNGEKRFLRWFLCKKSN